MFLLDLPAECILHIVRKLDNAKDILSLACLCRYLYPLITAELYRFNREEQTSSALHWAASRGELAMVDNFLREFHLDINAVINNHTPLMLAAANGFQALVARLLSEEQLDVNVCNSWHQTALHLAIEQFHEDVAHTLLLDCRVDAEWTAWDDCTPLMAAARNGLDKVVQALLDREHLNVNAHTGFGYTALHLAVSEGFQSVARMLLLDNRVSINCKDRLGATPLWWATATNNSCIVHLLLDKDEIDLDSGTREGPPLHNVVQFGDLPTIRRLLREPRLDPNLTDAYGNTALTRAAARGDLRIIEALLQDCRVSIGIRNHAGESPVMVARRFGFHIAATILQTSHRSRGVSGKIQSADCQ
ncbi:ankyrin repeat-containing domain protein [Aspergillus arachidicola]|uniref:Ankyrin repeat-containing domain protein n=1 Tax=Aspergillus arachidicola TaxID=656916 RepID=A0A5N6XNT8_9EURO|nr:ankyrin repeat-containing domain protein [Aspergillus arachidicola]